MAEIHNLSDPHMDVKDAITRLWRTSEEVSAHGAILLLVHGDDRIHMISTGMSYPQKAGYLQTAIQGAWQEVVSDE